MGQKIKDALTNARVHPGNPRESLPAGGASSAKIVSQTFSQWKRRCF